MNLRKRLLAVATATVVMMTAGNANAAITFNISQVGNDIVSSAYGSLDTSGLTPYTSNSFQVVISSSYGAVFVGSQRDTTVYRNVIKNGSSFGYGSGYHFESAGTGDTFGIYAAAGNVFLPTSYTSGSVIAGTAIFTNKTFASMGLNQGSYAYNLLNGDSITVNIGSVAAAAVPELASWAMMIVGMGLVGSVLRRRSAAVTRISYGG